MRLLIQWLNSSSSIKPKGKKKNQLRRNRLSGLEVDFNKTDRLMPSAQVTEPNSVTAVQNPAHPAGKRPIM